MKKKHKIPNITAPLTSSHKRYFSDKTHMSRARIRAGATQAVVQVNTGSEVNNILDIKT